MLDFESLEERALYTDLLRAFHKKGHHLYVISPVERRKKQPTHIIESDNISILKLRIGNMRKTNVIEKGISTLSIEFLVNRGIKKYYPNIKFDLVLYPTPPITFANSIAYIKKRDNAKTYLLLKDIFPQNAVDIGMLTKSGLKSIIYKVFRRKEKTLYNISDKIGCMSQANVDYVIRNNQVDPSKIHINPNSIEVVEYNKDTEKNKAIRQKWNIPQNKKVFIYGGNLGRPQDIPFLIKCLKQNSHREDCFFVICGTGTEYKKLQDYVEQEKPSNVLLLNGLPRAEYDDFIKAFDVGLIFLDHRFTIPNFPSRLLSYMQAKMPVICCTDANTDIGKITETGEFGIWCESNNPDNFTKAVDKMLTADLEKMGEAAYSYLKENYTSDKCCEIILSNI